MTSETKKKIDLLIRIGTGAVIIFAFAFFAVEWSGYWGQVQELRQINAESDRLDIERQQALDNLKGNSAIAAE